MSETPDASFSIREVAADEIGKLAAIESRAHVAPWSRTAFEAELGKPYSRTLVMTDEETDEVVAGYIVFWMIGEESQILNVAVDVPFRGRGFAQKLIRKVIDLSLHSGLKQVVLDVRKSNNAAVQLYGKLGFTIQSVRKSFYSNGEDAYGMVLGLEGEKLIDF